MLPPGFKKDSRVWLHKNPKSRMGEVDKGAVMRRFLDSDRGFNENSPCFLYDFHGKAFKKDSRSWLHKSSASKQHLDQKATRRKYSGPVVGDCCREPEFARSNTDVRLTAQQERLIKHKCNTYHASDGDILSNDFGPRQMLRKKRIDTQHCMSRRAVRTVSDEHLGDEGSNVVNCASLNTFGHDNQERMDELAVCGLGGDDEENYNHQAHQMVYRTDSGFGYAVQCYPSLLNQDLCRQSGIRSDSFSSGYSKTSIDTLAPSYQDVFNANNKGNGVPVSHESLVQAVRHKLGIEQQSTINGTRQDHSQLKMVSLCASPPGTPCSYASISDEDLKSCDVDV